MNPKQLGFHEPKIISFITQQDSLIDVSCAQGTYDEPMRNPEIL